MNQIGDMLIVQLGAVGVLIALSLYIAKVMFQNWMKAVAKKESILEGLCQEQLEEATRNRAVIEEFLKWSKAMKSTMDNSNTIHKAAIETIQTQGEIMEKVTKQMDSNLAALRDLIGEEKWLNRQQQQQGQHPHQHPHPHSQHFAVERAGADRHP